MTEIQYEPLLHPIEQFRVTGVTRELLEDVDSAIAEIDSNRPLPEEISQRLTEALLVDRVHSSAVLEGSRLNRRETIAALQIGVIEAGTSKDEADVLRLANALLALDRVVKANTPLTEADIRALHGEVVAGIENCMPGQYRNDQVKISGSPTIPPDPGAVRELMSEVAQVVQERVASEHPIVLAAWAHWAVSRVHPFRDGNGRVARIVQDYVLLRRHYLPVPLFAEDREGQYYSALEAADEGDSHPLVELIAKNMLRVADRFLAAIREEQATKDWVAGIARAAKERSRETDHRRFTRWERRVTALRLAFVELAEELSGAVDGLSIRTPIYQGMGFDAFQQLCRGETAQRTWIFGADVRYLGTRVRFVFWAARPRKDWKGDPEHDAPVVLVSMEESVDELGRPFYRRLDETDEGIITLREIAVDADGYARRRWIAPSEDNVWEEDLTEQQLARDFFGEILQRLHIV